MTSERDIERLLDHWLADGPTEAADRVVVNVADRIGRQRQQPVWRVSWRDSHMNAYLKPLLAVAAVVVIAAAGIAIVGRPSGPGFAANASPPPTPTPTPPTTPSPEATPRWDAVGPNPCGQFGCGGPLTAGTYTSKALKPAVTYTLTTNWVNVRDWPEFFLLYPDTLANRAVAAAGDYPPHILILPGPITVSPSATCVGDSPTDELEVNAAQFVEFVKTREHITTSDSIPVTLSGLTGTQIDVAIEPGWTGCIPGAPLGEALTPGDRVRFIVLDRPGGDSLMIRLRAPTNADALFAEAMPVVQSFQFDLTN